MFQMFNQGQEERAFVYTPTETNQRLARIRQDIETYGECYLNTIYDFDQLSDAEIKYLEERLNSYE